MTVEVYQSIYAGEDYNNYPREAFELATFFSNSLNFTIIDSYSSLTGRYKGDPIADAVWTDWTLHIHQNNSWFVIQCETSIHVGLPKWQCKIQWSNNVAFDDCSLPSYGYDGGTRVFVWRFSPYGGWDLADTNPDFNPTEYPSTISYRSSSNMKFYVGHGGSGNDTRWFLIADSGQLLRFNRRNQGAYDAMYYAGYMGDITPVDPVAQVMPRVFFPGGQVSLDYVYTNGFLPEDVYTTGWSTSYGGLGFENASRDWIEDGYTIPGGTNMVNYWSQPNKHAPSFQLDILPYFIISPHDTGCLLGTIPLIGRAYGPGFQLFDSKNWLSIVGAYGPVFKWDGSTDLNF